MAISIRGFPFVDKITWATGLTQNRSARFLPEGGRPVTRRSSRRVMKVKQCWRSHRSLVVKTGNAYGF